jgi:hypothetical protein
LNLLFPTHLVKDTLVDLNFDEHEEQNVSSQIAPVSSINEPNFLVSPRSVNGFQMTSNSNQRQVYLRLTEMGISSEAIKTGIELVGGDDEEKVKVI